MNSQTSHIRIVARQAVCSMVRQHVEVSVDATRALLAHAAAEGKLAARPPVGAIVSVELVGPDGEPHRANRMVSATAEASAWGIDEIVSAARRAADRILTKNPSWRRLPG